MKFLLTTLIAIVLATIPNNAQQSDKNAPAPKGWKRVAACGFSFLLPEKAVEQAGHPIDSCIAGYEFEDAFVGLDHGFYSGPLPQQEWMKDYQNVAVTINGRKARLITYEDTGRHNKFSRITKIHMVTGGDEVNVVSLLLAIQTKPTVDPHIAKRIVESVKYLGK